MKNTMILFLSAFLMAGCAADSSQTLDKKDEDTQIVQTELEKTPEVIVQDSIEKLKEAESFDMDFVEEDTPMNEFYKYSKTTISGTWTDVQNEVFEGNYGDVKVDNDDPDTKRNEMDMEGPITKKAGEDAILPAEYNGGYEYSIGAILMFPEPCPSQGDSFDEYSESTEEVESGTQYTFHVVDTTFEGNGISYQETNDFVYIVDHDGNLIYAKKTWIRPFETNDGVITDQMRTVVTEFKYKNIQ
ncbi:hypothetical protein [Faecalicoccus acidiformans]|uniref:hypothetical protein n=1 Tax=Faecalicoccus acidiformans TaxID=915173 RepID=UPI003208948E